MNRLPIDTPARSVTILGATGSVGTSTVDLVQRERERYPVAALSANKRGDALAKLAATLAHVLPPSRIPPPIAISKTVSAPAASKPRPAKRR